MKQKLEEIFRLASAGTPAALCFEADGKQYIRNFLPRERLILLGGGHIAQPLCRYGTDLGFSVTVVDDRPSFANAARFPEAKQIICDAFPNAIARLDIRESDYVAVITRGHRYDADCIRQLLKGTLPGYLGMIGSRRRVAALFDLLESEGYPRAVLDQIHSPIGLPIGALTVKEIAVSIVAELIQWRRRNTKRRSHETVLTVEDVDLPLLRALACDPAPKALLIVYETSGSTPVKAGALMAVDKDFHTVGTIGGGCGESAVLMDAFRMIGTGSSRCVCVDMSGDAAEDGMVCGGQMKVLIQDLTEETAK